MTPAQISMATALARVTFPPGVGTKRFARDMADLATQKPDQVLTLRQAQYLAEACVRYRRQLPREVVALARAALPPETYP